MRTWKHFGLYRLAQVKDSMNGAFAGHCQDFPEESESILTTPNRSLPLRPGHLPGSSQGYTGRLVMQLLKEIHGTLAFETH